MRNIAICGDIEVRLRPKEAELFLVLLSAKERALQRAYVTDRVWGAVADTPDNSTLDVHLTKLRKKLRPHGLDWAARDGLVCFTGDAASSGAPPPKMTCEIQVLSGVARVRRGPDKFGTYYFISVPFTVDGEVATAQALANPLFTTRIGLLIGHKLKREYGGVRWQRRDPETGEIIKTPDFRKRVI